MIWLILWLSLAQASCDKELTDRYSEYSIAKTIEDLGTQDGAIFADAIKGLPYTEIAIKHGLTGPKEVEGIVRVAGILLTYYRDHGL